MHGKRIHDRLLDNVLLEAVICAMFLAQPALGAEAAPAAKATQDDVPRVLLDQSPRAVEYQLARLTNDQLVRVERKDSEAKYRPVYFAMLTRKGMARPFRAEALATLAKMDRTSPTRVLIDALAKVPPEDTQNADSLLAILLGQPADVLRTQREALTQAAAEATQPAVRRGAYGGLMIADGDPAPAWQAAARLDGHLVELLRSVPLLGKSDELRARLFTPVAALLAETKDPGTRAAAVMDATRHRHLRLARA